MAKFGPSGSRIKAVGTAGMTQGRAVPKPARVESPRRISKYLFDPGTAASVVLPSRAETVPPVGNGRQTAQRAVTPPTSAKPLTLRAPTKGR